ncbi:UNVERIFIED_CONTAM: hypothetical protein IGO34_34780, partial [Salmonella enterica subsp. enterica serovar Weltevreden]
ILEQTAERYAGFDLDNLETERDLIVWYHKHGHWVQALTLMREWMVSLLCVEYGWDRIDERDKAEKSLNVAIHSPQSELEFL